MSNESERHLILEMIQAGKITPEEGLQLLKALPMSQEAEGEENPAPPVTLAASQPALEPEQAGTEPAKPFQPSAASGPEAHSESQTAHPLSAPNMDKYRDWWMIPMWIGVAFTVLAGWWMYSTLRDAGYGFWFYCSWVPFLLGLSVMALAWQSRTARWLHLRVTEHAEAGEKGHKIAISFPIPIRLTAWFLRTFKGKIDGLENISADQMLAALESTTSAENPVYIEVEEDDGDHVEIYIG